MVFKDPYLDRVYADVVRKDPSEPEFLEAVKEVFTSLEPVIAKHPEFEKWAVLERLTEPERLVRFRVTWIDDNGKIQVNRGYRIQYNSAIGPYKGGLRFHPSVNSSIIKFLAFEQTFKNSLTGFPIGGGKGGSDFDPRGKSDMEVMRFCQSYMTELYRHIGANTDIPAGDVGVGGREIGYLFGQYKRIMNEFTGVITGKDTCYGGSFARTEATGFGLCYFAREMLKSKGESFEGKRVIISGAGNVATYANRKATELGGKVVAQSDYTGYIHDENGIDYKILEKIYHRHGTIKEYLDDVPTATFTENPRNMWFDIKADIVLPCATQNEIDGEAGKAIVANGTILVAEGANMPNYPEAIKAYKEAGILYAPGKASNAGGVATSGLEMSQNSIRMSWTFDEVDKRLEQIMIGIYNKCVEAADEYGFGYDIEAGANIAGFLKVAKAMICEGVY